MITGVAAPAASPRELLEQAALRAARLHRGVHRRLPHPGPRLAASARRPGSFVSIISDIATQVEYILGREFKSRGFDAKHAPMYAQMLVGMVGTTGQWWLDARKPDKEEVAAHLVNLAWNGLRRPGDGPRSSGPAALTQLRASPRRRVTPA